MFGRQCFLHLMACNYREDELFLSSILHLFAMSLQTFKVLSVLNGGSGLQGLKHIIALSNVKDHIGLSVCCVAYCNVTGSTAFSHEAPADSRLMDPLPFQAFADRCDPLRSHVLGCPHWTELRPKLINISFLVLKLSALDPSCDQANNHTFLGAQGCGANLLSGSKIPMDELTDSPAVVEAIEIKMTVYWVRFLSVAICLVIKSNLIENLRLAESPINDFKCSKEFWKFSELRIVQAIQCPLDREHSAGRLLPRALNPFSIPFCRKFIL
ncbi:hypothetical protein H5410_010637 [Solanum commersonii]|uniref:Uncharacterized protein n=1 Tax=Solanum commersonii TaxID=4109 RepID=A0A9J6AMC2_SOLCO|nr:hypothetical protein H5410_010637 [Solanum commersonii]